MSFCLFVPCDIPLSIGNKTTAIRCFCLKLDCNVMKVLLLSVAFRVLFHRNGDSPVLFVQFIFTQLCIT